MSGDEHEQPPKTVPEIGIHIGYIRDDLKEIKEALRDAPTRMELAALEDRVIKLEKFIDGIKSTIAKWAVTIIVAMVLALYGIDRFFRG